MSEAQEKLAETPVSITPEDQREPPKALKKKTGLDRPRPKDNYHADNQRAPSEKQYKPFHDRQQNYVRERERLFEGRPDLNGPDHLRPAQSLRNGSDGGGSDLGKATMRNREQELRDPEFQRFRGPGFGGGMMDYRFRPPNMPGEEMDHMVQMMQGISFGPGPEGHGMPYAQHPNAMPVAPYGTMHGPPPAYGYQGHMMQQIPQGMGMYGAGGVPYGYPQVPQQQYAHATYPQQFLQPYPYPVQMRPTNGVMQPYAGQHMGQNMIPYYQTFVQQGYPMPGPHGGRPGFPGPPRPQQPYQTHPLPRNGSGGYTRKPGPANTRPTKPEANLTPKTTSETSAPSSSAPVPTSPTGDDTKATQEPEKPTQPEAGAEIEAAKDATNTQA